MLQREIRQRPPFRSDAQEAAIAILRTADIVRRHLAAVVEPHGITFQQYNVLRILRGARPEPLSTQEIGERLIEQTPGVTRLLDRLESKALVTRERCPEDRRLVHARVTRSGLELLARIEDEMNDADEAAVAGLGGTQVRTLIRLLERVRSGI
jgi:MarR family transcriptional regulator, organic hydroperoxide resistance regulator